MSANEVWTVHESLAVTIGVGLRREEELGRERKRFNHVAGPTLVRIDSLTSSCCKTRT
jgi:hypothetical protein